MLVIRGFDTGDLYVVISDNVLHHFRHERDPRSRLFLVLCLPASTKGLSCLAAISAMVLLPQSADKTHCSRPVRVHSTDRDSVENTGFREDSARICKTC